MRNHLFRLVLVGCLAAPSALAVADPARSAPPRCVAATPAALAGYFDGALPDRLKQDNVPGAVVSVVSGGTTVFAKGYGQADAGAGVAFSPDNSLVRIASITKLFTWTAVMQQVEAGRLDLNADVNHYLKTFTIPSTFPEPVTLLTLMNHTAGFEDRGVGIGARTAADVAPLDDFLSANMPARIYPPGEVTAYSNYGAALAGHIVSQVSGEPYDAYVRRHIFEPLAMAHSTAAEPVPAELAAGLARSYNSDPATPRPIPFKFDRMPPDGAISSTATDMANFMTAHLNPGRVGDRAILAPATVARMHQRSFATDPRLDGRAHGFTERTTNGHRVLMHDGSWEGFQSVLMLVPGCDLGLFVSMNGTGGMRSFGELLPPFFDRFTPASTTPQAPAPAATAAPKAGFYKPTRHNESTIEKLLVLVGPARLTVDGDGTVHFGGKTWAAQGDGLFRDTDGTDRLTFFTGTDGKHYATTGVPTYELMNRAETLPFNLLILLAFLIPALSALAVPLVALWRRIRRRPTTTATGWRLARSLAAGAAGLGFAFLLGIGGTLFSDTSEFLYGVPLSFRLLLVVPLVLLVTVAAAAFYTVKTWRASQAGVPARIHQLALLAAMAPLAWFAWQWNILFPVT